MVDDEFYNSENHTYYVRGQEIPGVTEICSPISFTRLNSLPQHILERARVRGQEIHGLCEQYLLTGELDFDNISSEYSGYMCSFLEWYKTYKPKILYAELILFGTDYGGTLDLIIELDGKIILLDIKATSQIDKKSLSVQLCGYKKLCELKKIHIDECWYLHLKPKDYVFKPIQPNEQWFNILLQHNKFMRGKYYE